MHLRPVGRSALLVECADAGEVAAAYADLRARAGDLGAVDVVPAARTVLLDGLSDPAGVAARLAGWEPAPGGAAGSGAVVEVPVRYDGPDLGEVAAQWGVDVAEVVRLHTSTVFRVAFCGFVPGFAYCTGLPAGRTVRRRDEPRTRVPAGSVALAGEFTSVYPSASPGGWQLIGTTDLAVWRADEEHPALLAPGARVVFVDA
ncbi:MAG TPA: allophanate hydrolase subunit 1 [Acidimicrobiales bacterium]